MRKSASEIIRNLENRVASLEKSAYLSFRLHREFYLDRKTAKFLEKKVEEFLEDYQSEDSILWLSIDPSFKSEIKLTYNPHPEVIKEKEEAEVVFFVKVIFADHRGKRTKKTQTYVLKVDPTDLEYDGRVGEDGREIATERSVLKAILSSRSEVMWA